MKEIYLITITSNSNVVKYAKILAYFKESLCLIFFNIWTIMTQKTVRLKIVTLPHIQKNNQTKIKIYSECYIYENRYTSSYTYNGRKTSICSMLFLD